jgi:tRNA(Arg) A34 adenosine deaminase TadA
MSVAVAALDTCIKQCKRSPMRSRHGAVIIYRNKVVAAASNYYVATRRPYEDCRSIHAEVAVIVEFLKKYPRSSLRDATLVVVRVTRDGELSCSRPCTQCTNTILKYNVGKVIHS